MKRKKVIAEGAEQDRLFERIRAEQGRWLYRLCEMYYPYDKPQRDGLYNDVLYRVWRGLPTLGNDDDLEKWLYRLATNTGAEHRRRGRWRRIFRPLTPLDELVADDDSDRQLLDELYRRIEHLSESDRQLIYLYLDNIPQARIAEILDISPSNVSTRINRIKNKLKEMHYE